MSRQPLHSCRDTDVDYQFYQVAPDERPDLYLRQSIIAVIDRADNNIADTDLPVTGRTGFLVHFYQYRRAVDFC